MQRNATRDSQCRGSMALRGVSCCLVLALAGWLPVTVRAGSTEEAEGGLSISTSPAGASVFVDGRLRGQSPLEIGALLVGDHRVKLVKDGYLENSRVLVVEADGTTDLDVTLTEATAGAGSAVQLGGGGGGGSIWSNPLFWAAVGGGAGAAIYLAVRDSNKAPTAAFIVNPSGAGMEGATSYKFDASSASDPDGDLLTYTWDFGGEGTATGQNVSFTFGSGGRKTVTLTASDRDKSATMTGTVDVNDNLTGTWTGSVAGTVSFPLTVTFTQTGTALTGTYEVGTGLPGVTTGPITMSSIASDNNFVCPCDVSFTVLTGTRFNAATFSGDVDAGVNTITGTLRGSGFANAATSLSR